MKQLICYMHTAYKAYFGRQVKILRFFIHILRRHCERSAAVQMSATFDSEAQSDCPATRMDIGLQGIYFEVFESFSLTIRAQTPAATVIFLVHPAK